MIQQARRIQNCPAGLVAGKERSTTSLDSLGGTMWKARSSGMTRPVEHRNAASSGQPYGRLRHASILEYIGKVQINSSEQYLRKVDVKALGAHRRYSRQELGYSYSCTMWVWQRPSSQIDTKCLCLESNWAISLLDNWELAYH